MSGYKIWCLKIINESLKISLRENHNVDLVSVYIRVLGRGIGLFLSENVL